MDVLQIIAALQGFSNIINKPQYQILTRSRSKLVKTDIYISKNKNLKKVYLWKEWNWKIKNK